MSRPVNGFNLYMSEHFDNNADKSFTENIKEGSNRWNELTPEQQDKYLNLAKASGLVGGDMKHKKVKVTTVGDVVILSQNGSTLASVSAQVVNKPVEAEAVAKFDKAQAWRNYLARQLPIVQGNPGVKSTERLKHIAKMWHKLSLPEQEVWA